jgi:adenosylmethionine-8-amino-7-oxononanoate aminotransferase
MCVIGVWLQEALHSLKGLPNVVDIRNLGLMGAVELQPRPGQTIILIYIYIHTYIHII